MLREWIETWGEKIETHHDPYREYFDETAHKEADEILIRLVGQLGNSPGIQRFLELYEKMQKYYA